MRKEFFLSSHDFGADSRPRKCTVTSEPKGLRPGSRYVEVNVSPSLVTTYWDEPEREYENLILAPVEPRHIDEIGRADVVVDILICPSYNGESVDERLCSRVGTGSLHLAYTDAMRVSPAEVRDV